MNMDLKIVKAIHALTYFLNLFWILDRYSDNDNLSLRLWEGTEYLLRRGPPSPSLASGIELAWNRRAKILLVHTRIALPYMYMSAVLLLGVLITPPYVKIVIPDPVCHSRTEPLTPSLH